jgi:hypothetical protein
MPHVNISGTGSSGTGGVKFAKEVVLSVRTYCVGVAPTFGNTKNKELLFMCSLEPTVTVSLYCEAPLVFVKLAAFVQLPDKLSELKPVHCRILVEFATVSMANGIFRMILPVPVTENDKVVVADELA